LELAPSSRDDDYYDRCRFPTLDAAVAALEAALRREGLPGP
jgi:hypothetical protein